MPLFAPRGTYPGERSLRVGGKYQRFKATGQFRPPKKGEYYLSGAEIFAYRAPNDLSQPYWIAVEAEIKKCPTCGASLWS